MNVKISILPILAVLFAFAAPSTQAQDLKFGVVEYAKVINEYKKTAVRNNELKARRKVLGDEAVTRTDELVKMRTQLQTMQKEAAEKNEAAIAKMQEQATEMVKIMQEKAQADMTAKNKAGQEIMKLQQEIRVELNTDIKKVIEALSAEKGLDLVHDKNSVLFVSANILDLTDEVIAKLNQ